MRFQRNGCVCVPRRTEVRAHVQQRAATSIVGADGAGGGRSRGAVADDEGGVIAHSASQPRDDGRLRLRHASPVTRLQRRL